MNINIEKTNRIGDISTKVRLENLREPASPDDIKYLIETLLNGDPLSTLGDAGIQGSIAGTKFAKEIGDILEKDPVGRKVVVYNRYLFAVPVRGRVKAVSDKDGSYQILFFVDNPGGKNVNKFDNSYFFPQECVFI